jgi:GDP/UDP-N,N'-diacetylbacillosamine 2-epimerase (hydrolysing)
MAKIRASRRLSLQLVVTGMHLLRSYGLTIREIRNDGFQPAAIVPMFVGHLSNRLYLGSSVARAIKGMTHALARLDPDFVVVFGDRLEQLAAALAAATLRIPIAHIEGGDKTNSGHIDEPVRHAITKFANLHFTATSESRARVIRMGEEPWRVQNVGALGLDSVLHLRPLPRKAVEKQLGFDSRKPFVLCLYHAVLVEHEKARKQMQEILSAIAQLRIPTVVIYPNNDPGSEDIIAEITKYSRLPCVKAVPNLEHELYVSILSYASVLVGNSSSGIIEAPSLGVPVVNVGSRNTGREHANNVIFVPPKKRVIASAITKALTDKSFISRVRELRNPYGNGTASLRIVKTLSNIPVNARLLRKRITL